MISANTRAMLVTKCLTQLFVPSKDVNCLCQHPGYGIFTRKFSTVFIISILFTLIKSREDPKSELQTWRSYLPLHNCSQQKKKKDQFGPFKLLSSH